MKLRPIVLPGQQAHKVDGLIKNIIVRPLRETVITSGGSVTQDGGGNIIISQRILDPHPKCPYGSIGDYLWVKEPYFFPAILNYNNTTTKELISEGIEPTMVRSSRFNNNSRSPFTMPRAICKLFLKIESIEMLRINNLNRNARLRAGYGSNFYLVWDVKYKKQGYSYSSNPFVWVIRFRKVEEQ